MAKLYFRYGTVSSAKTLNLLAVVHNYEQKDQRALLVKPIMDDRFGKKLVKSRAGLERAADFLIDNDNLDEFWGDALANVACIVVDEAQFLSEAVIDHFRKITVTYNIPVICYGLRTDFRTNLFEGARRLFEVADSIEEIKTVCAKCGRKAIINLKLTNGVPTVDGPQVQLGCEESYIPVCYKHYMDLIAEK
ncbi:thymidine kinase [Aliikangiella marina]|uniref:Thymidine kinase n=1 Tax=Aliikangiella marina TaxID=1712262 RepID=A0A545THN5_9GAMM|nr:thymidine kinase [Aliikangiella marina]TQV76722.1 thymidine kinase [Aliikangiella marina]